MTVQEIVTRVRAAIDELTANDSQFITNSEDEQNMTRIIVDKIGYALTQLYEDAPLDKLTDTFDKLTDTEADNFTINGDTLVASVKLPGDYLRFVSARLSSWPYYPNPVDGSSPVAMMQQDIYARGSYDRPVSVFLTKQGDRYLELYSAKTEQDSLDFTFIRKPDVPDTDASMDDAVDVPGKLTAAFIYQLASLTMLSFREEIAKSLLEIARQYMAANVMTGK